MNSRDESNYVSPSCLQETHSAYTDSAMEYDSSIDSESIGFLNNMTHTAQQQPGRGGEYSGLSKLPNRPQSCDSNDELDFLDVDTISDIIEHKRTKNVTTFNKPTIFEQKRNPGFRLPDYNIDIQEGQFKVPDKDAKQLNSQSQLQSSFSKYKQNAYSNENFMSDGYGHHSNNHLRHDVHDFFSSESGFTSMLSLPNNGNSVPAPLSSTIIGEHNNRSWKFLLLFINLLALTFIMATGFMLFKQKYLNEPLSKFHFESISNVLLNEDVLLFDISTSATNTNYEEIKIWDVDLDVFLITGSQNMNSPTDFFNHQQSQVIIFLGNSKRFQTPLTFPGTFYNHRVKTHESSAEVRLYKPAEHFKYNDAPLNGQQWQHILNANYTLLVRGELIYQLPFSDTTELVGINHQMSVNV